MNTHTHTHTHTRTHTHTHILVTLLLSRGTSDDFSTVTGAVGNCPDFAMAFDVDDTGFAVDDTSFAVDVTGFVGRETRSEGGGVEGGCDVMGTVAADDD